MMDIHTIDLRGTFDPMIQALAELTAAIEKGNFAFEGFAHEIRKMEYLWLIKHTETEQRRYYRLIAEGVPILDAMEIVDKDR